MRKLVIALICLILGITFVVIGFAGLFTEYGQPEKPAISQPVNE